MPPRPPDGARRTRCASARPLARPPPGSVPRDPEDASTVRSPARRRVHPASTGDVSLDFLGTVVGHAEAAVLDPVSRQSRLAEDRIDERERLVSCPTVAV